MPFNFQANQRIIYAGPRMVYGWSQRPRFRQCVDRTVGTHFHVQFSFANNNSRTICGRTRLYLCVPRKPGQVYKYTRPSSSSFVCVSCAPERKFTLHALKLTIFQALNRRWIVAWTHTHTQFGACLTVNYVCYTLMTFDAFRRCVLRAIIEVEAGKFWVEST